LGARRRKRGTEKPKRNTVGKKKHAIGDKMVSKMNQNPRELKKGEGGRGRLLQNGVLFVILGVRRRKVGH